MVSILSVSCIARWGEGGKVLIKHRFGGTLLGPARFTHIEHCTQDACVRFKSIEEIEDFVARLQTHDRTLAEKRAALAGNSDCIIKTQDYSSLFTTLDIAKARRLLKARESAIRSLEVILNDKCREAQSGDLVKRDT